MSRIKRNESITSARRISIAAYDSDGAPADPRQTFAGTNELLVDPSAGAYEAPDGTLANETEPLTFTPFVFTTTHASNLVNATANGLKTGSGPVQLTTTTTLPAGYALGTNYWWIVRSDDTAQLASSLVNALAGTAVVITDDGTGTHTVNPVAGTKQLVPGEWVYTASQDEVDIAGTYFKVRLEHDASTGVASAVDDTAGTSTLTGTGFLPKHIGRRITVAGFSTSGNNGEFAVLSVALDGLSCTYANPDGADETHAATYTIDDAVRPVVVEADLYTTEGDALFIGAYSRDQAQRLMLAVLAGPSTGFTTGAPIVWKCPLTGVTRLTATVVPDGRDGTTFIIGDLDT